jgi:hypothetical protein
MSNRFEGEHGRCLVVTEPDANELPGATARRAGATARALGAAGFTGDLPEERRAHLLHECVVDTRTTLTFSPSRQVHRGWCGVR